MHCRWCLSQPRGEGKGEGCAPRRRWKVGKCLHNFSITVEPLNNGHQGKGILCIVERL